MRITGLPAAALLLSTAAFAGGGDLTLFAGPVAGGSFEDVDGDGDLDIDAAAGLGLALHVDASAGGQFEVFYLSQRSTIGTSALFAGGDADIDVDYLQFGGNYPFGNDDGDGWQPYVMLTVGAARFSPDAPGTGAETFAAMTGGVGTWRALGERLALRFEARALATWIDEDTDVFCVSASGLTCAIRAEGDVVWQWTATAAIAWRF